MRDAAFPRHGPRRVVATFVAATVAMICVWPVVYADPAGGVFAVVLRDDSCRHLASRQLNQPTDCDPDAPSWTATDSSQVQQNSSQVQQVIVADNVEAAGAVAVATEQQDAPITQLP